MFSGFVWCEGMEICMTGCLLRNLGHMLLLLGRATHYCVHIRLCCRERHCISIYMPWASPTRRGIECTWPYYAAHVMTVVYLTLQCKLKDRMHGALLRTIGDVGQCYIGVFVGIVGAHQYRFVLTECSLLENWYFIRELIYSFFIRELIFDWVLTVFF